MNFNHNVLMATIIQQSNYCSLSMNTEIIEDKLAIKSCDNRK